MKWGMIFPLRSTVRENTQRETASIYGNFIFSVSTLYSAEQSPIMERALTTMYQTFSEQSMDNALDAHEQDFNFVQSYYTASLMLSRTINSFIPDLQRTDDFEGFVDITEIQEGVVQIESDESWGEGMKAVQMQSRHLAAQTIARAWKFFKEKNDGFSDETASPIPSPTS